MAIAVTGHDVTLNDDGKTVTRFHLSGTPDAEWTEVVTKGLSDAHQRYKIAFKGDDLIVQALTPESVVAFAGALKSAVRDASADLDARRASREQVRLDLDSALKAYFRENFYS